MACSISLYIPAFNAASTIKGVIARIPDDLWKSVKNVWIIDDGSTDRTAIAAEELSAAYPQIRQVHLTRNKGYGNAVRIGLSLCRNDGCDFAACVHADGQYPPESVLPFVRAMAEKRIDLMQGSRIASGTALRNGMPLYKYAAGRILTALENRVFSLCLTDYHSGFLVYSRKALDLLPFYRLSASFDFDLEVIASARAAGMRIAELSIPTRYAGERSYLNPVTYGLRVLGILIKYLCGHYRIADRGVRPSTEPVPSMSRGSGQGSRMGNEQNSTRLILITGGTGAMGSVLMERLMGLGYRVRALTLPGDANAARFAGRGVDVRYGDVADAGQCKEVCDGVHTVLHLAAIILTPDASLYTAVNAGGTRNMVQEAERSGASNFIHISSASVTYPRPTPYSISKRIAEESVRKSRLSWTIVRPTLVYGKKGGQEFDLFMGYLKRFPIVPFIGRGEALKRPVYVDDVVDGLVTLATRMEGTGKVYNFSGGTAISIRDFARFCLILSGARHKPMLHLPLWLCHALAAILKWVMRDPPLKWSVIAGMTQDANLDPSGAMADLGYAPAGVETMLPRCFPRA
jgi:nucleoside-diphosphate-sugar epimerase/glycosyltransferase involved in cell wall biosynthesis